MSEVAVRQGYAPVVSDPTGGRLVAWAEAAQAAHALAVSLCKTAFAPKHFRDNPGDTTAAIIAGDELGLSPLAAMRSIYVIHGTPALYTRTMVALVQSQGHDVWTEKSTDTEVVVCGQRRGSARIERAEWKIDRARKAGYTANAKYASNPQDMLYAKGAAEVCRKIAADVLLGVPFTVEDIELDEAPTTTVKATARVSRKRPDPVVVEPEFDTPDPVTEPELGPEPDDAPEPVELIRDAQSKKMFALFKEKGFIDRDDRLAYVQGVIQSDVASSKDLTVAQASQVIDALDKLDA